MNKRHAKQRAELFEGTFGDLVDVIMADDRDNQAASTVNPALTHGQAKDVFLASVSGHAKGEPVEIWVPDPYSRQGHMKRSINALIVQNIFRECG